ncbi:hypothetical protein GGF32_009298 [Allomyces javanicus]|nr:hypothetical protein GGF32_009298 [Allomyces javanicus]
MSGLNEDEYVDREINALQATEDARNGHCGWLLVPAEECNQEDPTILASCETFHRTGQLGGREVDAWVLTTVYVPEPHRGKGYAKDLSVQVRDHLIATNPDLGVSILFSDVGPYLYAKLGWQVYPSTSFEFRIPTTPSAAPIPTLPAGAGYLNTALAMSLVHDEPPTPSVDPATGCAVFTLPFTPARLAWHEAHRHFYYTSLGASRPDRRAALTPYGTDTVGARIGGNHIVWFHHPALGGDGRGTLFVLHVHADSADAAAALLRIAAEHAVFCGLGVVEVHCADESVLAGDRGEELARVVAKDGWVHNVPRHDSLSSLLLWRDGQVVEDPQSEVAWYGNEKYSWS